MHHIWTNVKNSSKDGHLPLNEYQSTLETELLAFEASEGVSLQKSVREALGAESFQVHTLKEKSYTDPFPHLSSHGKYLFGCMSVPADIDDGRSDFTNVYLIATESRLLTVLHDPHWVYNAAFGGAVLGLFDRRDQDDSLTVEQSILKLLGFAIAALDHSLDALDNRRSRYKKRVRSIDEDDGRRLEVEIDRRMPSIESLSIEINSLETVIKQTAIVLSRIEDGNIKISREDKFVSFFQESSRYQANGMTLHASRLVSFQKSLAFDTTSILHTLNRLQEKSLVLATHRIGVLGAFILVPNLIFDYFGQAYNPLPNWYKSHGWLYSTLIVVIYWLGQYMWFRRKRYL